MKVDLLAGAAEGRAVPPADESRRIVIFDSGLGGLTVQAEVAQLLPGAELIYIGDTAVFPYGHLPEEVLTRRVASVIGEVIRRYDPHIVVIACNTASTLALPVLRQEFPIPFVGTVPAIKPAAQLSKTGMISVLATPGTVARDYTRELIAEHARDRRVNLVASQRLASLAEAALNGAPVSDDDIAHEIDPAFVEEGGGRTDVIVLACTHYPLLRQRLEKLASWPVTWIDSAPAIARRVQALSGNADAAAMTPARALFTADREIPPALREALAARGIAEIGHLPVPS